MNKMVTDCDFVSNTEHGDLCTLKNKPCDYKTCELYKYGIGEKELLQANEAIQQIKDNMNR